MNSVLSRALERGEVLQYQAVADAVVGVDAEPEAGDQALRHVPESGDRGQRGHVLLGGAESGLVAAHQDVGAAVDQQDRVDAEASHQCPVRGPQRLHPGRGERPDGVRQLVVAQPAGQREFRELPVGAAGVGRDPGQVRARPGAAVQAVEVGERQVRQVHFAPRGPQRERDRQPRVHVVAAARAGDQDPLRGQQPGEQGRLEKGVGGHRVRTVAAGPDRAAVVFRAGRRAPGRSGLSAGRRGAGAAGAASPGSG